MSSKTRNILYIIISAVVVLAMGSISLLLSGCNDSTPKENVLEYSVQTFEELKDAFADDSEGTPKRILLTADIDFTETLAVQEKITLTSVKDVTLTRAEEFDGSYFSVQSEGVFDLKSEHKVIFDGKEKLKSTSAILNLGTLTLGKNIEFQNFIGNQRGVVVYNGGLLDNELSANALLEIDGATIHDNKLDENAKSVYGIVYNYQKATFNFKSGKFYNNSTHTTGALFIFSDSTANFMGGEIYDNVCTSGGIIYVKSAKAEFGKCKIHNNKGTTGIVYFNNEADAVIDGIEITDNETTDNGGAIYLNETSKVVINSGKFNGNKSAVKGGVIYTAQKSTLTINGGEFLNNYAGTYAGVAYLAGSSKIELNGGTLKNNKSKNSGGTIFVDSNSQFIMNGGLIDGSTTEEETASGGAIINKSFTTINGGTISNNSTYLMGGAIRSYLNADVNPNAKLTITGGKFENNNNVSDHGGAIHCVTVLEVTGGEFISNSTTKNGGAIYFGTGCTGAIEGAIFKNNSASGNGGAVYFVTNCEGGVNNCKFEQNVANNGGAVAAYSKNLKIENSNFNANNATDGGAVYLFNTVNIKMNENIFESNEATSYGGAVYTAAASQTINGGIFTRNVSAQSGGGIFSYNHPNLEINGTQFSLNESNGGVGSGFGGGGLSVYSNGKAASNVVLNNTKFEQNVGVNRGQDIYAYCASNQDTITPIVTINDGEFDHIGIQYATLRIGGDVVIKDMLEFHATKNEKFAYLEIIKEVTNPFKINSITGSYTEEKTTTKNRFIRFNTNDPWSNIYSQVRKITLLEELAGNGNTSAGTKPGYGFKVSEGQILMCKTNRKINIDASVMAIDAPVDAVVGETVNFKVFDVYSIENVKVINDDTNEEIQLQQTDDGYSFTMPDADVTISYTATSSLKLTVDENIKDFIQVDETYQFLQEVNVVLVKQFDQKVVKLFIALNNGTQIDLLKNPTFKMFKGARIQGEISKYYEIGQQTDDRIKGLVFLETDCDDSGKAYAIENEVVKFKIELNDTQNRYIVNEVSYKFNGGKVVITKENDVYTFINAQGNIEIEFVIEDLLEGIEEGVVIFNEEQLNDTLSKHKIAVIKDEIVITKTITLDQGTYQIIGVKNAKLIRGEQMKGAFFDIGFKAILNLGADLDGEHPLILDGNATNVSNIKSSIIVCRDNGVLNIYNGVSICNNTLQTENVVFSADGYGQIYSISNVGGAGIINVFGQVNMYGGEIFNNQTTGKIDGAGVYNYGTFNLFSGSIHDNTTVNGSGAGIYSAKSLTLKGGKIENNNISGNGYGAGIYMLTSKYAHTFIYDGEISGNTSPRSGAGMFVSSLSSCFIHGGVFNGNKSTKYNGGAINSRGNLYIYGGTFTNNTAVAQGGAIYQYICESTIAGGKFENNSAANGGAICYGQGAIAHITGGEFLENTATNRGGAICLIGQDNTSTTTLLTITGGTFQGNVCENGSFVAIEKAILELGGTPTITDGNIKLVIEPTSKFAFIRFISNFSEDIKFNICPNSYTNLECLFLQIKADVNPENLLQNILLDNPDYEIQVKNGHFALKNRGDL